MEDHLAICLRVEDVASVEQILLDLMVVLDIPVESKPEGLSSLAIVLIPINIREHMMIYTISAF